MFGILSFHSYLEGVCGKLAALVIYWHTGAKPSHF